MQQLPEKQTNIRPRLAVRVAVAGVLLFILWLGFRMMAAEEETQRLKSENKSLQAARNVAAHPEDWLQVGQQRAISDAETLRLIKVNGSVFGFFGTECLIYTNSALRTSQVVCSAGNGGH